MDLGYTYDVAMVKIWNRRDKYGVAAQRLQRLEVRVGSEEDWKDYVHTHNAFGADASNMHSDGQDGTNQRAYPGYDFVYARSRLCASDVIIMPGQFKEIECVGDGVSGQFVFVILRGAYYPGADYPRYYSSASASGAGEAFSEGQGSLNKLYPGSRSDAHIDDNPTEVVCTDTCKSHHNGQCNDGGPGANGAECDWGTDCSDCGYTKFHEIQRNEKK